MRRTPTAAPPACASTRRAASRATATPATSPVMTAWRVSVSTMIYEKDPDRCAPGVCINTEGGFACDCDAGYQPSDDGMACIGEYDDL
ncbi:hypothetical protein PYW07_002993 [Mythimna separata]|uniref:EGF-like calcium-binding domain-containing protein n=1 Tax=Mythimna separata TaxID=271217 RepID=A0AAD7YHC9_MYTSE|nr:hypothetical protein PYW07_002993 [Mythimna separata]